MKENTAVRSILQLKYDTPSNIVHHTLTVSNWVFELSKRYVGTGLGHSIPLVVRQVEEYKDEFESNILNKIKLPKRRLSLAVEMLIPSPSSDKSFFFIHLD
ncbi:hypothetical protein BpHYR1_039478 [Brachionus plicatilis]|uniref:Uncharacterized protein n=1 Tax=Brachionus plicatilis TaxID=10195 RepID=A0A3M7QT53_BRAPC|nr:hypothetical protein BpHYR1_039478 [Brachionus plicatilis]